VDKKIEKQAILICITVFFSTIILSVAACVLYGKSVGELIQISVISGMFSLFLIFVFLFSFFGKHLFYDNGEHPIRFLIVYLSCLLISVLLPLVDRGGWFFVCMAIDLALITDMITGLFAISGMIMLTTLLSGSTDIYTFLVYFFASLIGIVLFRKIDQSFKVGPSIFVSQLCLFVFETAGFIFLENKELSAEQFIYPIVNIVLNSVILFLTLKYFNEKILDRYRNRYLELNDQEYTALTALKNISKEEYFRSIHTAYLTERIANATKMNVNMAKNLAYYHRIKSAFGFTPEQLQDFVRENDFPPEAAQTLLNYCDKEKPLTSREECVVFLSDKFISMLMLIFNKDSKADINISEIIDTLMNKPVIDDALSESELTRKDFKTVKEIMKKEVLYYDFLR